MARPFVFLMAFLTLLTFAYGGVGTLKTNWVDNKCGYDAANPSTDQRFAQIKLDYSNTVTGGTVQTVKLVPQAGAPDCQISSDGGATWNTISGGTLTNTNGPIDVRCYWTDATQASQPTAAIDISIEYSNGQFCCQSAPTFRPSSSTSVSATPLSVSPADSNAYRLFMPAPISNLKIGGLGRSCEGGANDGQLLATGNFDQSLYDFQWLVSPANTLFVSNPGNALYSQAASGDYTLRMAGRSSGTLNRPFCVWQSALTTTVDAPPSALQTSVTNVWQTATQPGRATVSVTGGYGNYEWTWVDSSNNQVDFQFTDAQTTYVEGPGTYNCTVNDRTANSLTPSTLVARCAVATPVTIGQCNCAKDEQCSTDGTNVCNCPTGFAPPLCDSCAASYFGYPNCVFCDPATTCNAHGICAPATGLCQCTTGFTGASCASCDTGFEGYPNCQPATTTPVPTTTTPEPTTTTPEPTTTPPAPTTTEVLTTTPAPTTTTPVQSTTTVEVVTTVPVTTTTEVVTTTPAPTTTTPAPTTTEVLTTTPVPTTTTPVPTTTDVIITTTPVVTTTEAVTTTPVPTTTDVITTPSGSTTTDVSSTTPVPTTSDVSSTTPVGTGSTTPDVTTTAAGVTTTPVDTTTAPPTTTPVITSTAAPTTTPAVTSTDPATSTAAPTSPAPTGTTAAPATSVTASVSPTASVTVTQTPKPTTPQPTTSVTPTASPTATPSVTPTVSVPVTVPATTRAPDRRFVMQIIFSACVTSQRIGDLLRAIESKISMKKNTLFVLTLGPCVTSKRAQSQNAEVGAPSALGDIAVNNSVTALRGDSQLMQTYSVQQVNSVLVDSYLEPKSKKSIPIWVYIVIAILVVVVVALIVAFIVYVVVKRRDSHDSGVHYAQMDDMNPAFKHQKDTQPLVRGGFINEA